MMQIHRQPTKFRDPLKEAVAPTVPTADDRPPALARVDPSNTSPISILRV